MEPIDEPCAEEVAHDGDASPDPHIAPACCLLSLREQRRRRGPGSLTEAGIRTLPILVALGNWGLDWREGTPELRARQELVRAEGAAFVEELMDELRVRHLGAPPVERAGPRPLERLEAAYAAARS